MKYDIVLDDLDPLLLFWRCAYYTFSEIFYFESCEVAFHICWRAKGHRGAALESLLVNVVAVLRFSVRKICSDLKGVFITNGAQQNNMMYGIICI